ncbi:thioredoxin-dependent thiol peroxidase [Campylobacter sp. MIT 21-1685]|uniref:thioredoxin-dependent thiol peroxidase n=1 Tax=unclassified Campylobacter TaxID=2593542 RepID=UPI00224A4E21|nr:MULTISPECIES: thioredoxin-dependent thiol peroxidase [unclassified Campylobacter]MCX2682628.1 thioredoxin-dependent thiol peroxidase [Campylobacter sp. MIT 21-1684]MCX2750908.1 thioredoxin-dependent thiol peroxidase [Campylobacter sp. MIT 21-1682]MCX2807159.1 thioredoxin-dependent thiol peroxidase [Campylobacter sp. MIT 21-1685]
MKILQKGDKAPEFELLDQDGIAVSLKNFIGKKVIIYFYPKDDTPGCTTEACDFSGLYKNFLEKNTVIIGISPDSTISHKNFAKKFNLSHILLSDTNKEVAKAYGVWGLKKNYGKEYEGIIRSTFILDEKGTIVQIYSNVRVKEHAIKVLGNL